MNDPTARLRLEGLEPENLLAFLALLGCLRALEEARPEWRPRVAWDIREGPSRPILHLRADVDEESAAVAAAEGVATLAAAHDFDRADIKWTWEEMRALQRDAEHDRLSRLLIGALASDAAVRDSGDEIWPTPYCLMFGQGHQHFLARLADVPRGVVPKPLQRRRTPPDLRSPRYLAEALFEPWTRTDPTDGFRWDPDEDRRYALRARNPSGDPAGTQHGANVLAAVGMPVLPGTAISRGRGGIRFVAAGAHYGSSGQIHFCWPISGRPVSLRGLARLMMHPGLHDPARAGTTLRALGVRGVMRAERYSIGKFMCVSPAVETAL